MKSKWLGWAGLALLVSPWGCGGSAHEQRDPANQGGAGAGAVGGGPIIDAGSPSVQTGGSPSYSGAPTYNGGSSGAPTAGNSNGGASPVGNCDYLNEVTITSQSDADRVSGCSTLNGVYVADVAESLVIDWPALTTVNGELHFAHSTKLTSISLPNLRQINGELYLKGNTALKSVELPGLVKISGDPDLNSAILIEDNAKLAALLLSLDLRVKGLTIVTGSPLLCDAENFVRLLQSNALAPASTDLPACAFPDLGAAGAGGSADF